MRLTLRTMLAYLDDILEPDDAAEIGRKIDESEFATDLVRRTRDVMRRLRLGAPQLMGRGMGMDPNTVAEYLDNTMPPEQVADFERVCLESDMHLAEVSACHQVLTLVLGEPAEVLPASRERMYAIPAVAEKLPAEPSEPADEQAASSPETSAEAGSPTPPTALTEAIRPKRQKPEIPEYLREARRSRWRAVMATFLVAVLLGGGAMYAVSTLGLLDGDRQVVQQPPAAEPVTQPPLVDLGTEADLGSASGLGGEVDTTDLAPLPGEPAQPESEFGAQPLGPQESAPQEGMPAEPQQTPAAEEYPLVESTPVPETPEPNLFGAEATAQLPGEPPRVTPPPAQDAAETMEPGAPLAAAPADADMEGEMSDVPVRPLDQPLRELAQPSSVTPTEPAPAEAVQRVGIYVFDKNVLLRAEPQSGDWQRVHQPLPLNDGDRLLSLPTYRNTINLSTGVTLQMIGGTSVVLRGGDAAGAQEVELLYGRIVLMSVGREDTQVRLKLGQERHRIGFDGAGSMLAVELERVNVPGQDPQAGPAPVKVELFVPSGEIDWYRDDQPVAVKAPAQWHLAAGVPDPEATVEALPDWITAESLSTVDRNAALTLEAALTPDRPLALTLAELVEGRQLEVRALAARSSVYIGQFQPFVAALNDADQHARWDLHIETLRQALARGPGVAEKVREAFLRRRGDDGEELYRMLWGYSDEDLAAGADKKLVSLLSHDSLDYRVLAFWNLREITGKGLNYRPEYTSARRQQSVRRWQERANAGEIRRADASEAGSSP